VRQQGVQPGTVQIDDCSTKRERNPATCSDELCCADLSGQLAGLQAAAGWPLARPSDPTGTGGDRPDRRRLLGGSRDCMPRRGRAPSKRPAIGSIVIAGSCLHPGPVAARGEGAGGGGGRRRALTSCSASTCTCRTGTHRTLSAPHLPSAAAWCRTPCPGGRRTGTFRPPGQRQWRGHGAGMAGAWRGHQSVGVGAALSPPPLPPPPCFRRHSRSCHALGPTSQQAAQLAAVRLLWGDPQTPPPPGAPPPSPLQQRCISAHRSTLAQLLGSPALLADQRLQMVLGGKLLQAGQPPQKLWLGPGRLVAGATKTVLQTTAHALPGAGQPPTWRLSVATHWAGVPMRTRGCPVRSAAGTHVCARWLPSSPLLHPPRRHERRTAARCGALP